LVSIVTYIINGKVAGVLAITRGYHPMHGSVDPLTREHIIMRPNDLKMSTFCSLNILRGANSSGKSTYMKQTGLLCVLAQAGLWVPATAMCLHPFEHIFTRMNVQDSLRENSSTFMMEARV
jgi:DNA mismatch repair ATPase MutS